MKSTGIVRNLDELGRIVIPKEIRKKLGIDQKDPIEVYIDGNSIVLKKYEKGCNRVGASRLWDISKVLDVTMDFFFEDMDKDIESQSPMMQNMSEGEGVYMLNEDVDKIDMDPMKKQETMELVRAYYRITNRALAKQLFDLIVSLSKTSSKISDE